MSLDVFFNAAPLLGPKTGIGEYCLQLMTALQAEPGIRSHYFYSWQWSRELHCRTSNLAKISRNPLRRLAEKFPNFAYQLRYGSRSAFFSAGLRGESARVYHETNFMAFKTRLPTVVTVHDLSILHYPETHPSYRVAIMQHRIGESARRADVVITDAEFVRREVIEEFRLPEERVIAVPLAAASHFSPVADDVQQTLLAEHGLRPGNYVLAVGTVEPRKNLITAIKAYALLPDSIRREMPFVIVGMQGWRMEGFDQRVARLIEAGQIRRLGYVTDAMLPVLYSGARTFVYPSLYEGFGLPPLEAMSCGTPVIVSTRSTLPEVVGDAGLQVEALDVDALADAMRRVIEDDGLRSVLSRKGIERAAGFSWQKCAQQMAGIYRKVAA